MKLLLAVTAALAALALPVTRLGRARHDHVPDGAGGGRSHHAPRSPHRDASTSSASAGTARGSVRFSVRALGGGWGPWLDAAPEEDDQPDVGSPEAAASRGWRLGNPTWVGPSNGIRYRLTGRVRDLRATFVRSPVLKIPLRAVASAGAPPIVPRSAWGADESIVREAPVYAPAIRFASVHHTAGPNDYGPAQVAAILRGIQIYHVKSNGWNDIGYNFLVDRYGTIYEGRAGGIDRNVVGAHIRGFNTGAVGVAVIGTFSSSPAPAAAEAALEKLLAWRLDLAHVDPLSSLTVVSGGSERYVAGTPVTLRAVSGHRDTGLTTCPGDLLYARLPAIAAAAQALGLPKLYEPKVTGGIGGRVRFQARVSGALPWKVTVADSAGPAARRRRRAGAGRGLDVGRVARRRHRRALAHRRRRRHARERDPREGLRRRRRDAGAARDHGRPRRPGHDQPERRRPRRLDHDLVHDERRRHRLRHAARRERRRSSRPSPRRHASRQARTRSSSTGSASRTASTRSCSPPPGTDGLSVTQQLQIAVSRTLGAVVARAAAADPERRRQGRRAHGHVPARRAPRPCACACCARGSGSRRRSPGRSGRVPRRSTGTATRSSGATPDGAYAAVLDATDAIGTAQASLPFQLDARPAGAEAARPPAAALGLRARDRDGARERLAAAPRRARRRRLPLTGIRIVKTLVAVARDAGGNSTVLRRP